MKWKVGMFLAAVFLAVSTFGYGVEAEKQDAQDKQADHKWEAYSKDRNGLTFLYEKETIDFGADGTIKVWRKREFPVRSRHKEIIALDQIDCIKQKHRSLELQVVGWNDSVESFKRVAEWSTIYGDSPEEFFLDHACKELKKQKK
jgi:hypothetical protein